MGHQLGSITLFEWQLMESLTVRPHYGPFNGLNSTAQLRLKISRDPSSANMEVTFSRTSDKRSRDDVAADPEEIQRKSSCENIANFWLVKLVGKVSTFISAIPCVFLCWLLLVFCVVICLKKSMKQPVWTCCCPWFVHDYLKVRLPMSYMLISYS